MCLGTLCCFSPLLFFHCANSQAGKGWSYSLMILKPFKYMSPGTQEWPPATKWCFQMRGQLRHAQTELHNSEVCVEGLWHQTIHHCFLSQGTNAFNIFCPLSFNNNTARNNTTSIKQTKTVNTFVIDFTECQRLWLVCSLSSNGLGHVDKDHYLVGHWIIIPEYWCHHFRNSYYL